MRWCRFGTDFFACDCEKLKMYWMYIEFFGKKQAGKDVPPNQSAVPKQPDRIILIHNVPERFLHDHAPPPGSSAVPA